MTERAHVPDQVVGQYHNAIKRLIRAPFDPKPLRKFKGKKVARHALETDPKKIREIERRGDLAYEDIYDE